MQSVPAQQNVSVIPGADLLRAGVKDSVGRVVAWGPESGSQEAAVLLFLQHAGCYRPWGAAPAVPLFTTARQADCGF